jgi:DNA-binding transcriptional regulator YhcF (GntR family)
LINTIAMQAIFEIDASRRTPKYLQIVNSITKAIKQGRYKKGDRICSINELSNEHFLSRDTVQKAYDLLEKEKIIEGIRGKGFYINRIDIIKPYRILLLFNKISNYKKVIFNSFSQTFGKKATIDLKIFHSNTRLFSDIIEASLGEYDYYVIMPHFYEDFEEAYKMIEKIPGEQLFVLDKDLSCPKLAYSAVYQDFKKDIAEALESGLDTLRKYRMLTLVFPKTPKYPYEIVTGFRSFCTQNDFDHRIITEVNPHDIIKEKEAFVVIEETDLVNLIKNCQAANLKLGKDVGIVSYNDTPLKEILSDGISVISTDHAKMGETAARMILENRKEKIKNPFHLILRNSL